MILKKLMCGAITAALLFSAVSCASETEQSTGGNVTVSGTSSEYADYIEKYSPKLPDSLILAVGEEAAAYGMDTAHFVDSEGYSIRARDGEVVILAVSDGGMDRAVREYVKNGNAENYTFTYGEDYRVGSLSIAGNDISEYALIVDEDADTCNTFAATELVTYIKKTCGAALPTYTAAEYASATDAPSRRIVLSVDYPALGDEAFTIRVEDNGDLTILGGRYRGCMYGVYSLLRDIGWRFASDSIGKYVEYLYEAESVDLTAELNRTEDSDIAYRYLWNAGSYNKNSSNLGVKLFSNARDFSRKKYGIYGTVPCATHGISDVDFGDFYDKGNASVKQPCYSNEDILDCIETYCRSTVENRLESGQTIGRELSYLDISQFDNMNFCYCETCYDILLEEGSESGTVLRMTNRMADVVMEYCDKDAGEMIYVTMLAYAGTNEPPRVTVPEENVKIAYCFYIGSGHNACSNHPIDGSQCDPQSFSSNCDYAEEFQGWRDICTNDNLQVWYYPLTAYDVPFQPDMYTPIYDSIKYLVESGISGIVSCGHTSLGITNHELSSYLISLMSWNSDISREEFYGLIEEWYFICYGDAGSYMYDYFLEVEKACDTIGCWTAFNHDFETRFPEAYMGSRFEYFCNIFDLAMIEADTTRQSQLVERTMAGMLFPCISARHTDMYLEGTEEERAFIAERYEQMHRIFTTYKMPIYDPCGGKLEYVPEELVLEDNPIDTWLYDYIQG